MKLPGVVSLRKLSDHFRFSVNRSATVILGNQKSGTSAIAHLLADACALTKTVDIPAVWPPAMDDLLKGDLDLDSLARQNRELFSREVIKEPYLTFVYPALRRLLPDARFVFVVRDPRDNVRSILNRLAIPGDLDHLSSRAAELPQAWSSIFESELWGFDYEHYIDILAARWVLAVSVYLEWAEEMELVRYEDFLKDKMGTIHGLASSLGLKISEDISDRVNIQFQPRGQDRGLAWEIFFGEHNLQRIDTICGRLAGSLGYGDVQAPGQ